MNLGINRTCAFVHLKRYEHNLDIVRQLLDSNCKLMSVLKSDAYGHGAKFLIPSSEKKVDYYAVASFEEAVELRNNGATKPILILGHVEVDCLSIIVENNLAISLLSLDYAKEINDYLLKKNLKISAHIKIDTGLNRTGIKSNSANLEATVKKIERIYEMHSFTVKGIFTHFACSDSTCVEDRDFTEHQFSQFKAICDRLQDNGYEIGLRHVCSSTAILLHKEKHLDMVRVGMLQYGQTSSEKDLEKYNLLPILNWKAKVIMLNNVAIGESIGYSRTIKANKNMNVAVISIGFGDGYRRNLSNKSYVLIKGRKVPVLGKVAMDFTIIDVTGVENIKVGDTATVLGWENEDYIHANMLSEFTEGVIGEVTCGISKRVPRVYIQ